MSHETTVIMLSSLDKECNPVDIISKHWGYQQVWLVLKAQLFYGGNTLYLYEDYEDD